MVTNKEVQLHITMAQGGREGGGKEGEREGGEEGREEREGREGLSHLLRKERNDLSTDCV